jgi:hypothetical protein
MRRALGAAALVALVSMLFPTGAATAQERNEEVTLLSQTPWVAGDGAFDVRLAVDGVEAADQLDLEVTVHTRVRSRSEFSRTLEGALLGGSLAEAVVPVSPDTAGGVGVRFAQPGAVGAPGTAMEELEPGVYPVSIRLRQRNGPVVDDLTTHLVRSHDDPGLPPLSIGVVVPFSAPPALQPDGTTVVPEPLVEQLAAVADAIDVTAAPVTLVPTPETVDALGRLERDDVLDALRRSVGAGTQLVARPYVELTPATLTEPRLAGEVAAQRLRGVAAVRDTLGAFPDPGLWVAAGPVDAAIARDFDALGVEQLVVTERSLEPLAPAATRGRTLLNPFLVEDGAGEPFPAVAADAELTRYFTDGDDQVLAAHHLLADLAVLYGDFPGLRRGTVVMPPAGWEPDGPFLRTVVEGLASNPTMLPVPVDRLLDEVPLLRSPTDDRPVTRTLLTEPSGRVDVSAVSVADERAALAALGRMTDPGSPALARLDQLLLVSQASPLSAAERRRYISAVEARVDGFVGGVSILRQGAYRLTAREGTIPVTLRNANDVPIDVELRLASDKIEFDDAAEDEAGFLAVPLTLEPGNTFVAVDVMARTSGDFPLELEVTSPDGTLTLDSFSVAVRSTVASGVGVALSIGAGLFLLVWWARHWRSTRRDRRLVDPDTDHDELVAATSEDPA